MSLTVNVVDQTGKKVATQTLSKELFDQPINSKLLAQAVRVHEIRQHQHTAEAKTRGQVNRTTAKVWRQKGTGRARHGSRKAPIFVGGGVAHGPKSTEKTAKLTKKMKQSVLKGVLTIKQQEDKITLFKEIAKLPNKTKKLSQWLAKATNNSDKILLVLSEPNAVLIQATNNLQNTKTTQVTRLNAIEVIDAKHLLIDSKAVKYLEEKYTHA